MSGLRVEGLYRRFGQTLALDGMEFDVAEGEFFCLLGPSSSGKTTTLRAISGLEELESGRVVLSGHDVTHAPVQGRGIAMIFQTFALYPHLTIEENLAYPLRRQKLTPGEVRRRVTEAAELLRVSHTLDRKPATLSGGEQQRVAIGRAIIGRPNLLLLDEPLTNLDAKLRHDMRAEFKRLHRELGMTMLYATPDQLEALTMGQRIGVIQDGKIVACGSPDGLYREPESTYVASMVGSPAINLLDAATDGSERLGMPFLAGGIPTAGIGEGREVTVGIRPHDLGLAPAGGELRFPARIALTEPLGDVTIIDLDTSGAQLKMVLREEVAARYEAGQQIEVGFNATDIHVFDRGTGTRMGSLSRFTS